MLNFGVNTVFYTKELQLGLDRMGKASLTVPRPSEKRWPEIDTSQIL